MWSPRGPQDLPETILTVITTGTAKRPPHLGFYPSETASQRPSGRQDLNLRPLDPQALLRADSPAWTVTVTCNDCPATSTDVRHDAARLSLT